MRISIAKGTSYFGEDIGEFPLSLLRNQQSMKLKFKESSWGKLNDLKF